MLFVLGIYHYLKPKTIRRKILLAVMSVGLISTCIIVIVSYLTARQSLQEEAFQGIEAVRETRQEQIELWLIDLKRDVNVLAQNADVLLALRSFRNSIDSGDTAYGQTPTERLAGIRAAYLARPGLRNAEDNSIYSTAHNRFHPFFREALRSYDYDDILLLSLSGDVIYSVAKHDDFGLNLAVMSQDSSLVNVFEQVLLTNTTGLSDFTYYLPAGRPVAFLATPVTQNEVLVGVLVVKVPIESLNQIVSLTRGLGQTGQTYIVGQDFLLRSSLRSTSEQPLEMVVLNPEVIIKTKAVESALQKQTDTRLIRDYRGRKSLSAWSPVIVQPTVLDNQAIIWALIVEKDFTEVVEPANDLLISLIAIAVIINLALYIVAYIIAEQISEPLQQLTKSVERISSGHLEEKVEVHTEDEVGILGDAFNLMTQQLRGFVDHLENRVNIRTRDLEIAMEVSKQVASLLALEEVLPLLAEKTRAGFDLYHVSVYLYSHSAEILHLEAGTGEIGQRMKLEASPVHISEPDLLAKVARQRSAILINDTRIDKTFVPNVYLPNTHSELVLPMLAGQELVGILDLHARQPNRFSADDIRVMQSLAEQIGIAVRNAQLYTEVRLARDEAQKADRVKSSFLAAVSHELRTPLNGILNFTRFVLDGVLGPINEQQTETLRKTLDSGKHLLALINDVLDISRIESGSLHLFVEDGIDLGRELQDIYETGKALLNKKPVALLWDIPPDLPLIRGDRRRIKQIVYNLVSNACKFTQEGQITLTVHAEPEDIVIAVKDTGPGIAEADQTLIFNIFTQSETGLRQGEGTGLGLPISRHLVEAHGGHLWLESTPGLGASFYVKLPIASELLKPTLNNAIEK
jgi:signal transduction histidine kinase/HAMP domain-containing protein